jgi:hypothetical protein
MRCFLNILTSLALATLSAGCQMYDTPVLPAQPMTEVERNFESYWRGSLDVLRGHDFEIDLQERRRGLILTEPLLSRHGLEFWRDDAATSYDVLEGTLQTVYVTAVVRVTRLSPESTDYKLAVEVYRIRSDEIEASNTGAAGQRSSFKKQARAAVGLEDADDDAGGMVSLGRDEFLANKLLDEIELKAMDHMAAIPVAQP